MNRLRMGKRVYPLKTERTTDFVMLSHKDFAPKALPSRMDLSRRFPACYDQGSLGSCTANALVAVFQYTDHAFFGSRLFLYYNERQRDGDVPDDAGSTLSQGIASLEGAGLSPESCWPYNPILFAVKPPLAAYKLAEKHRVILATHVKQDIVSIKTCLANGLPIVVGISIYASFESREVAATGIVPMPAHGEACLGGHAVVIVGYDDSKNSWIMRNSWGTSWGDDGYFHLPYAYLSDTNLASDLWVVSKTSNLVTSAPHISAFINAKSKIQ